MTIACVLAAAVFYAIGFGAGVESAVVAGCVGELVFWMRVSRGLTFLDTERQLRKSSNPALAWFTGDKSLEKRTAVRV